jgi:exodeoxyribonuclease-5
LIYKVEEDDHGNRSFNINVESPLTSAHVLVLDECSMLSKEIAQDALSFGTKVLVLGDPGQLPPIDGAGYFNVGKPDVLLTEIHRQAADSPILHLATLARKGQRIPPGQYGNCTVVGRVKVDKDFMGQEVVQADQVLVGKNATRHLYNNRIRELKGLRGDIEGWHPTAGDKLICLRNDHKKGYLNGALWLVDRVNTVEEDRLSLRLSSLDDFSSAGDDEPAAVAYPYVPAQFFNGTEDTVNRWVRKSLDEFCFGWAMTVHKAQGSEFNHLVVFDESAIFREDASRHRYTAITRASEKLTLVL